MKQGQDISKSRTVSEITVEPPTVQKRRRFSLSFWFALVVLVMLLALMLLPRRWAIVDRARPIDLESSGIHLALESYKARFGQFPSGDSAAVFRALRGENSGHMVFFQCPAESVSPDGGVLDPWGTPYRLHLSGDEIIVRSAGPNRQFDGSGNVNFDDYIR